MTSQVYPEIKISHIKNPSRFYAVPLVGFFVKLVMIIPVGIELFFLEMAVGFFSILNSLNIFFRGRYWKMAYELNLGVMQLQTNVAFFLWGLTDEYPGFSLQTTNYDYSIAFNKTPSRILATPLLGMLFRFVMLIPYYIFSKVISTAAFLALLVSWAPVLFMGKYPETTYEIGRDSIRIDQSVSAYMLGMSDAYPSWWISMNHKTMKIVLIVLAVILTLWNLLGNTMWQKQMMQQKPVFHAPSQTVSTPTSNFGY